MVAMNQIQGIAERIIQEFDPDKIILFGSYAQGTEVADSDVDLLVILTFEEKPFWKSLEIINKVNPTFPVDLLARRPEDTEGVIRRATL